MGFYRKQGSQTVTKPDLSGLIDVIIPGLGQRESAKEILQWFREKNPHLAWTEDGEITRPVRNLNMLKVLHFLVSSTKAILKREEKARLKVIHAMKPIPLQLIRQESAVNVLYEDKDDPTIEFAWENY